jgi:hypothetical protein
MTRALVRLHNRKDTELNPRMNRNPPTLSVLRSGNDGAYFWWSEFFWGKGHMTMDAMPFSLALTHLSKGSAKFTIARQKAGPQRFKGPRARQDDTRRCRRIIETLYLHHSELADGSQAALPPEPWINQKLSAMGETWRVRNVDDLQCEVFEARDNL